MVRKRKTWLTPMLNKTCPRCGLAKTLAEFTINRTRKDGHQSYCKLCMKEFMTSKGYAQRPEYKEKQRISSRQWRKDNPEKKIRQRMAVYGITPDEWGEQWDFQDGKCAICGTVGKLVIDHDHNCCPGDSNSCGRCLRGLVCGFCNKNVIPMAERPVLMQSAANYLARPPWVHKPRNFADRFSSDHFEEEDPFLAALQATIEAPLEPYGTLDPGGRSSTGPV